MHKVVFACVHNGGRSQMAAAWFNRLADPRRAWAVSAGTSPAEHVHPEVVRAMHEVGIDLAHAATRLLTEDVTRNLHLLITMGCGDECPAVPSARRADWPLDDPKNRPIEQVRAIRDEIRKRVQELIDAEGWGSDHETPAVLRPLR